MYWKNSRPTNPATNNAIDKIFFQPMRGSDKISEIEDRKRNL